MALIRLRVNLALALRDEDRYGAEAGPSACWQRHLVGRRMPVRSTHADFPALLAEALDVLDFSGYNVRTAAARLKISPTQLTRFLAKERRALQQVNDRRRALGLRPLR